jgi:tryptophan 2,3-dioxygenase
MDFLDFRDLLRPASGFQSWQFKTLEAKLGLRYENRHGLEYYLSQLNPEQVALIREAEGNATLMVLVDKWLERMPFPEVDNEWWQNYANTYRDSLSENEKNNLSAFEATFTYPSDGKRQLSPRACRAALFIMLYRGYPILQLPFQLLNTLLEIDEQLSTWRYRHMNMVNRIIGTRIGTGGSSGKDYLKGALDKHSIFGEIAQLTSFLVERRKLPQLERGTEKRLGF